MVLGSILLLIAVPLASAQKAIDITPSYIAGAELGWTKAKYKQLLGTPRVDQLEGGLTRLVFAKRKVSVYLKGGKGIAITTWSKVLVDEEGITPCSSVGELKAAWGAKLKPFKFGGAIAAYRRSTLLYAVEDGRVDVIMLGPAARNFVALNETGCR